MFISIYRFLASKLPIVKKAVDDLRHQPFVILAFILIGLLSFFVSLYSYQILAMIIASWACGFFMSMYLVLADEIVSKEQDPYIL